MLDPQLRRDVEMLPPPAPLSTRRITGHPSRKQTRPGWG